MRYFGFAIKILVFLTIVSGSYYFLYLKPQQEKNKLNSVHYSNLVQNRSAYINLAKLDEKNPDFDTQRLNLTGIIRETNAKGLENPLTAEEKRVLEKQAEILAKVFATKSYQEGLAILKSEESLKLLADEAKLIESYKTR